MRLELFKARIEEKIGFPIFNLPPPDHCLPWTGAHTTPGPTLRKRRDSENRPFMAMVVVMPTGVILFEGKQQAVHRVIYKLLNPGCPSFNANKMCRTTLCVNPDHWTYTLDAPYFIPPIPPPEPMTAKEAENNIDRYLLQHPYPPLDPTHWSLIDIPQPLLEQVLRKINKEHLIPQ